MDTFTVKGDVVSMFWGVWDMTHSEADTWNSQTNYQLKAGNPVPILDVYKRSAAEL